MAATEEQFIFETEIRADVNTKPAEEAVERLRKKAKEAGERIKASFDRANEPLKDVDEAARAAEEAMSSMARKSRDDMGQVSGVVEQTRKDFVRLNDDITKGFKKTSDAARRIFSGTPREIFGNIQEAFAGTNLENQLRSAIKKQAEAIKRSLEAEEPEMRDKQRRIAMGLVEEIENIRGRMARAGIGVNEELARGIESASDLIGSAQWETAQEVTAANEQMANSFESMVGSIESHALRLENILQELTPTWSESLSGLRRSMELITSENVGLVEGVSVGIDHLADFGKSIGFLSDESVEFVRKIGSATERVGQFFGKIKDRGVSADKSMVQVSSRIEDVSVNLKTQQQVITRLFQTEEANTKKRIALGQKQLQVMKEVLQETEEGAQVGEEAANALYEVGIKGIGSYEELEHRIAEVTQETAKLTDQQQSMSIIYRKNLSQLANQFNRLESNAMHFGTTLENSGRVAGERIRDMSYNLDVARKMMQRATDLGLTEIPELAQWFTKLSKNVDHASRSVRELEAHEKRFIDTNGRMGASFARTAREVEGFRGNVSRLGRLFGRGGKVSSGARSMNRDVSRSMRGMRSAAGEAAEDMLMHMGSIDPVFSEIASGARNMGFTMGSVMDEMDTTVAMKGKSIAKTLGIIKLAAAGVIGVFGGLIVSTGKLASEVTTLEITLKTVGENLGFSREQVVQWRDDVKAAGITTRAATNAITQFLRAKLPTDWHDPIQDATYSITDLARAAQNLAVSMGQDSSETFSRFIYFIQTGNSQLLDTIGIAKNASVMLEEYADALGKTVKQLTQREYYEALISGLMREGAQIQGVYEEAMKTASKQLGSMKRYLEELRYEWGKNFEPIIATAIFNFNKLLKALTEIPDETKKTISSFIAMATAISGVILGLGILLPKLKSIFTFMKIGLAAITGPWGLLLGALALIGPTLVKAFVKFPEGKKGIEGMVAAVEELLKKFSGLKEVVEPLLNFMSDLFSMIGYHMNLISYRIRKFVEAWQERTGSLTEKFPEIVAFFEKFKVVINDLFVTIWRVVEKVLVAIEKLLDQDWEGFYDSLASAGRDILTFFMEFFNEIAKSAFEWGKNIISAFVSGLVDKARTAIPRVMAGVGSMIANFLEGHSPAKMGPLSNIDRWGGGLMNAFERGLRQKRILFDEDMFTGIAGLGAKARVWGDNIVGTFATGIASKAATALVPTMDYVGNLIARFLEGRSPPPEGRLQGIQDWGRNAFETFLAGFQMADFSILDTALDLVGSRLSNLMKDSEESAVVIARAMGKVRDAVGGAIFASRTTGGPLDLSALRNLVVGGVGQVAQDIADVLEANFAALQAAAGVKALQKQIAAAQAARRKAIQDAQDRVAAIRNQIENTQKEIKALEEQMEEEFRTRAEAMGILVDPKLMESLRREMERASIEVQRAQRRIERVRSASGKYGVNILTWEEINAQAQLDLAKQRQDQVQEQIWYQEELQRQADELRAQIEEEYQGRFDALNDEIKAMQERAERAEGHLKALQKADQDASAAEQAQLAAAQEHAQELADRAAFMSKLLDERMKAEKDALTAAVGAKDEAIEEIKKYWDELYPSRDDVGVDPGEEPVRAFGPGDPSTLWEKAAAAIGVTLEGGLGGVLDQIRAKIGNFIDQKVQEVTNWFLEQTTIGRMIQNFQEGAGAWGFFRTAMEETIETVGIFIDAFKGIIDTFKEVGKNVRTKIFDEIREILEKFQGFGKKFMKNWKPVFKVVGGFFDWLAEILEPIIDMIGDLAQGFLKWIKGPGLKAAIGVFKFLGKTLEFVIGVASEVIQILIDLILLDFDSLAKDFGELVGEFEDWGSLILNFFAGLPDQILGFLQGIPDGIVELWNQLIDRVAQMGTEVLDAFIQPFKDAYDRIVGNSIMSDLVDDVVAFIEELPDAILRIGGAIYNAAVELGMRIYNGIRDKVQDLVDNMPAWMVSIADRILDAAGEFWNKAWSLGNQIYNAINSRVTSIRDSISGWLGSIATRISDAASSFWTAAVNLANNIKNAFLSVFFDPDNGIIARMRSWLESVVTVITEFGETFWGEAWLLARNIYNGMLSALSTLGTALSNLIVSAWNNYLRHGFNAFLQRIEDSINTIILGLNLAWIAIGAPGGLGFPLDSIDIPDVPPISLDTGGIITSDVVAQLHAGEVVLPLDRLDSIIRKMNVTQVPAFSPVMNFYPGSSPQQVMPAIHQAYDWYTEEQRRGL